MSLTLVHRSHVPLSTTPLYTSGNRYCSWCWHTEAPVTSPDRCQQQCTEQARVLRLSNGESYYFVDTMTLITARLKS